MSAPLPRVLVVDDDDVYREVVRRHLRGADIDCTVDEADSLARARDCLEQSAYDCVVLDHRLGDGDAFDVLQFMAAQEIATPVVVLTQTHDVHTAVEAMKFGAHDFLTKELVTAELLGGVITRAMATRRLEAEAARQRDELERLSFFDTLSGLPNRNLFFDRLDQAIRGAGREDDAFALLMMDLDLFKSINDRHGHDAGDEVLREVGRRLAAVVRDSDTVARLGGDEFAAVLNGTRSVDGAIVVAEKIVQAVSRPIMAGDVVAKVGVSVGIAVYPGHGSDGPTLLKCADTAMYEAKHSNAHFAIYEPAAQAAAHRSNLIATDLRAGAFNGQLELHYQPKVSLADRGVLGVETLVRWRHPQLGLLAPAEFIPAAERSDTICDLTLGILDGALAQQGAWRRQGIALPLSVNLSARMLDRAELPELVADLTGRHGTPPGALSLEVTETAALANPDSAFAILIALSEAGHRISIDDFGAGYTSFRYLREIPVDEIKIDRLFVSDLGHGGRDASIVRSMLELGRGFGIEVVAEGIETLQTWHHLTHLGCAAGQGFYIARPTSAPGLLDWYAHWQDAGSRRAAGAARRAH